MVIWIWSRTISKKINRTIKSRRAFKICLEIWRYIEWGSKCKSETEFSCLPNGLTELLIKLLEL